MVDGGIVKNTPYFKITQIADRHGITRQAVYKWVRLGKLRNPRIHPIDGSRYWLESDLPPLVERAAPPMGDPLPEGNWE